MKFVSVMTAAALAFAPMVASAQGNSDENKQRAGAPLQEGTAIPAQVIPEAGIAAALIPLIVGGVACALACDNGNPPTSTTGTTNN